MLNSGPDTQLDRIYKSLIVLALLIAMLVFTKDIVMPMAFAGLFSVVLLPFESRVEGKVGRVFSILTVLLGSFIFVGLITWFIFAQLTSLVASLPDIEQEFTTFINGVSHSASQQFRISTEEQTQMIKDGLTNLSEYMGDLLLSTSYLLYFLIQVPIYIFIFLLYREKFTNFMLALRPGSALAWKDEIQGVIRNYISGLMLVVLIAGTLNSIGLLALGIEHAIFFGFLSGVLTMIPYIGITIGAALPTLLAIVTKDSLWYAVGVIGVHAFVQFLESNFITPKITGSKIRINALAAIVALLIGGKIWGIAGMILAIPSTGILKILLSYSSSLKPLVILIEDRAKTNEEIKDAIEEAEEEESPVG
jgi:predicted PurR-regulated permease PerM